MVSGFFQTLVDKSPVPHTSRQRNFAVSDFLRTDSRGNQIGMMEQVSTVFSIVDLIASKVAAVDWKLYRKADRVEDRVEITSHFALDLWEHPNDHYTQDAFIEANQQFYELTGEMWIVLESRTVGRFTAVTDLWPISPERLRPIKHPDLFIVGYEYRLGNEKIPLPPEQVIFEKRQNPRDPWRGLSPLPALMPDIESERNASVWNAMFFKNNAEPAGVLQLKADEIMNDTEWEKWLAHWKQAHQGVSNSHRVAVMEMGEYIPNQMTHRDMQFVNLRNFSRESMMEAWRVSKSVLGHVEDVNRANNEGQQVALGENILIPRLERWKKILNHRLLPSLGGFGEGLEFDYENPVPTSRIDETNEERKRALSVASFVREGFEPAAVLEAFGFPTIDWIGVPDGAAAGPSEDPNEGEGEGAEEGEGGGGDADGA